MNAIPFVLKSLAVGSLAAACVALCPPSWRSRVRLAVPVAAFAALVLLVAGLVRPLELVPLPKAALPGTKALTTLTAAAKPESRMWMMAIWAGGCGLFLLRMAAGTWAVWRILRSTRPVPGRAWQQLLAECQEILGLHGTVRLRMAGPGFVPSAAGLLRRTVLIPDEARDWTREQRKLVLLHELGHFRRGDLWAHALGRLACALHWFNPFVWMLQRHLAVEREFACDELVLERGAHPDDYATLLFEMATAARRRPALQAAFLTMASRRTGKLEARVRRILAPMRRHGKWAGLADRVLCLTLAGVLVMLCAVCRPVQAKVAVSAGDVTKHNPEMRAEVERRFAAQAFGE